MNISHISVIGNRSTVKYGASISGILRLVLGPAIPVAPTIDGQEFRLAFWDLSGDQAYGGIMPMDIRKVQLVVRMFDLTNPTPFAAIGDCVVSVMNDVMKSVSSLLIDGQRDLEDKRAIWVESAEEKQQKIGAFECLETSAANRSGIDTMFDDGISECKKWLKNELNMEKGREIIGLNKTVLAPEEKVVLMTKSS